MLADAAAVAKTAGKQLFVGEFGDAYRVTPFISQLLKELVRNQVSYAAIWVWEYYQSATYRTHDTPPSLSSLEPGYSDDLIALMRETERALGGGAVPQSAQGISPRVVLTWPLPCAVVDRPVDIAAVASDGAKGVKSVEFFADGKFLAVVTSPPFVAHFNPAGLGERGTEIEARALARAGAMAAVKSSVRLNGPDSVCTMLQ